MMTFVWILLGIIIGIFGSWLWNFTTDKIRLARLGYSVGKGLIAWIVRKLVKKKNNGLG